MPQATEGELVTIKFNQIKKSRGLLPSRYRVPPSSRRKAFVSLNPAIDPKICAKRGNASTKFRKTLESKAFSEIFGIRRM